MARFKSESSFWVDQLAALETQLQKKPVPKRDELKTTLNLKDTQITYLMAIKDCFDTTAIQKVRSAAPFVLSSRNARALSGLNSKVKDLPIVFHTALDTTFARCLAGIFRRRPNTGFFAPARSMGVGSRDKSNA